MQPRHVREAVAVNHQQAHAGQGRKGGDARDPACRQVQLSQRSKPRQRRDVGQRVDAQIERHEFGQPGQRPYIVDLVKR